MVNPRTWVHRLVPRSRSLAVAGWLLGSWMAAGDARALVQVDRDDAPPPTAEDRGPSFQVVPGARLGLDVAHRAGAAGTAERFLIECLGSGLGLVDVDADGDLDVYLVQGGAVDPEGRWTGAPDGLRLNDGRGRFSDPGPAAGELGRGFGFGVSAGDLDGDGDEDLLVTNLGANELLRNDGSGRFSNPPGAAGLVGGARDWSLGASLGDPDVDGDLDVYVTNYLDHDRDLPRLSGRPCLWPGCAVPCGPLGLTAQADRFHVNDGRGAFVERTVETGLAAVDPGYAVQPVFVDLDGDGDLDLFVANDSLPNSCFLNQGPDPTSGLPRFEERGRRAGLALSATGRRQASRGVAVGDLDGDLAPDLVTTSAGREPNALFLNASLPETGALFFDEAGRSGLGRPSDRDLGWGASLLDADHDGDRDLLVANGQLDPRADGSDPSVPALAQPERLYEQTGPGRFRALPAPPGAVDASSRGAAAGDLDGDGDVDLVLAVLGGEPLVWRNLHAGRDDWLMVDLRPLHAAVGARVVLEAGEHRALGLVTRGSSFLCSEDRRLHFGLPQGAGPPAVSVRWPDGHEERFPDLDPARVHVLTRGTGR